MTTRSARTTQTPAPNDFVDLTAEDSDDVSTASEGSPSPELLRPPSTRPSRPERVAMWQQTAEQQSRRQATDQLNEGMQAAGRAHRQAQTRTAQSQQQTAQQQPDQLPRAPPFGHRGPERTVIVLSDGEDSDFDSGSDDLGPEEFFRGETDGYDSETVESAASPPSMASPEVQFLEERRIPQPRRPQPPAAGHATFALPLDILRRGTSLMLGNMQNAVRDYNEGFLDRLDGVPRRNQPHEGGTLNITMDYARPGFAMFDPFDRGSETPQVVQEPYKAPPVAKEGFTRTYKEEDVILCPMCGDELAIGKGDVKQQVWVVKGCGHVYCGECATNRSKSRTTKKGKGKENEKKLESTRSPPFSVCQADKCTTKVVSKTAMFPIYL
ncbi:hypothetical protein A1O7_09030 [Cladophialophora yegresii CBS 114405]|uniref:RING-type domain-containing protein n=1 Tax=Cladophialophora yegresii CBS 114405 TaxID=1182544 RepID=W9WC45_9EURO|nr:uncharacterized protein A1O7_09030 [Cladophialophora yegresii CBS 114405]EXJ56099.1 hypothetical protein A1O7_09030 [Cladophialophora yegresii CBS 114405]